MNKEFMLLNDNTIEITNENGIETNRGQFENNNVKSILLSENKVEIVEEFKKRFDKELSDNNNVLKLSSSMLKLQVVLIVALPLFWFLYGALTNPNTWLVHAMSESVLALAGSIIPITISTIYWAAIRPKYKNNRRKMQALINKTDDLTKEYEKELLEEKQKNITKSIEPLVRISLEEETNAIAIQIAEELIEYHQENINQRGKVKIRKR